MVGAVRIREVNNAREKMGEDAFLDLDDVIKESFEYGLCKELVLNDSNYQENLLAAKEAEAAAQASAEAKVRAKANAEAEARRAEAEAINEALERRSRETIDKFSKEGVTTTASGLKYIVLTVGTGSIPTVDSTVEVHYAGRLLDGTVFDSSVGRGVPAQFGVTQVIEGWVEVLQLMPEGSKWEVYIPSDLAYGEKGSGPIGQNQDLIFEIELLQSNIIE
jgi:FKBP-type peptidyl-prolyl cis-trans isomerase FklB